MGLRGQTSESERKRAGEIGGAVSYGGQDHKDRFKMELMGRREERGWG